MRLWWEFSREVALVRGAVFPIESERRGSAPGFDWRLRGRVRTLLGMGEKVELIARAGSTHTRVR